MYGRCGKKGFFGQELPCPDNNPARKVRSSSIMISIVLLIILILIQVPNRFFCSRLLPIFSQPSAESVAVNSQVGKQLVVRKTR